MNSDDFLATLLALGIIALVFWIGFVAGERFGDIYKNGYTQALADTEQGNPARYVLKNQGNGETIWIENKEQSK